MSVSPSRYYQPLPNYQPYQGVSSRPYAGYAAYYSPAVPYSGTRYANSSYSGGTYPPNQLLQLKQQLGSRIINTSREPVSLAELTNKNDGDPITASPFASQYHTGVPMVDGAMQQAGTAMGHVSHGVGNFVSTSVKGALFGGLGTMGLAGGSIVLLKLLGHLKGTSWGILLGGSLLTGLVGSLLGGVFGITKAVYNSIRDAKNTLMGNF
jgi:hypothetical protein